MTDRDFLVTSMAMARLRPPTSLPPLVAATILAAGCSGSLTGLDADGFHESASVSAVSPSLLPSVRAALTIRNTSGSPRELQWPFNCDPNFGVVVRAYRQVGGKLVLAWNSEAIQMALPCPTSTTSHETLAPGDSDTFQATYSVDQILADSLPAGSYSFTVTSALVSPSLPDEVRAGTLALDNTPVVPPGTNLDGTWTGSTQGVTISLALTFTRDSVYGSGTYSYANGGGTGPARFDGRRQGDSFYGPMRVGDWWPPFSARLTSPTTFHGEFFNVDTPPTPVDFTRGR